MNETLSIQLDRATKQRLEALARRSRRSEAFLASRAITAYIESEEWQLSQIREGIKDFDQGAATSHKDVSKWLRSWGSATESKAPK